MSRHAPVQIVQRMYAAIIHCPEVTLRGFLLHEDKILAGFPFIISSPAGVAACHLAWELSKFYPPFTRGSW